MFLFAELETTIGSKFSFPALSFMTLPKYRKIKSIASFYFHLTSMNKSPSTSMTFGSSNRMGT